MAAEMDGYTPDKRRFRRKWTFCQEMLLVSWRSRAGRHFEGAH